MQMQALNAVFEKQSGSIVFDRKYTNEYEAIKLLHTLHNRQTHERIIREFLTALEQLHHVESTGVASQRLREEGNQKYKSSSGDKELLLSACRLYTEAILTAENSNNELCLAYANRGMALQDYGYYRQAYDDCACALEFGYPKKLHHKLIMRQAYCAWKLGNLELLEEHIHSLRSMQLNESFQRQLLELQENVQHLTPHKGAIEEQPVSAGKSSVHQIVNEASSRGRYMIAKERIPQGSIIFTESAECFVPLEKHLICQQCAATQLIPIPCPNCHKRVVYCSRQCRERHKSIHKYECAAYKRDLLHMLGISHLALRLVLTYLPLLTPQLQKQRNASELWHTFISLANDDNDDDITAPQYLKTLRMITHLDKVSETELTYHMLCANLLRAYLFECTDFFDQFADTSAPSEDWQLFIAACILRSSGQLMVNGHVGDAIMPITLGLKEFTLLQPKLWDRPHHLQLGSLHKFSAFQLVTAMNLPHLSLCNHSCIPSIRTKFEGRSVVNYALRDIEANEEIFNCYTGDCKTTTFKERRKQLKNTFKFICCCVNCRRQHPDEEYFMFETYRCENPNCRQTFVPPEKSRNWWKQLDGDVLICDVCKEAQNVYWYEDFLVLFEYYPNPKYRRELFKEFERMSNHILNYHVIKLYWANEIVNKAFNALKEGCPLDDVDYEEIVCIMRWQLDGITMRYGPNSIEYITKLTYLWDLIALGKYKCCTKKMQTMLDTLEFMASEPKNIFLNYYHDFIEQHCTSD